MRRLPECIFQKLVGGGCGDTAPRNRRGALLLRPGRMRQDVLIWSFAAHIALAGALPSLSSRVESDSRTFLSRFDFSKLPLLPYRKLIGIEGSVGTRRGHATNLNLRGGKLDGFATVIIDNLAAAEHFESLLCTSRLAISNAFRSIDLDDSGHISKPELEDALRKLGVNATDEEVESIFNGLDENKDGGITFEVRAEEQRIHLKPFCS
jgi:hypothetical protein